MKKEDFTDSNSGCLVRSPKGGWAFVPKPLPPEIPSDWSLTGVLSRADRSLSKLAGLARNLPNPHILIRPFIRREAVMSSRIEGSMTSISQLFLYEALDEGRKTKKPADPKEVINYVRALEYGLKRIHELPLSLRLIREMHRLLMDGVRGRNMTPGEFRKFQSWIGAPGCSIEEASFVPPPPPEMHEALSDMERFLHANPRYPPLIRIAFVHYQFEAIHPFNDGNGRIGRLLITLMMCLSGLLTQPLLYLSSYFDKHRSEYYRRLRMVSQQGDWVGWIKYFLRGVEEESHDAVWRAGKLLDLRRSYREKLEKARTSALLLRLLDGLFGFPIVSIPLASKRLGVGYTSVKNHIEKLVDLKILTEVTGQRRNRFFAAPEIIDLIEIDRPEQ